MQKPEDVNDPYSGPGVARKAQITHEGILWNASFAYLDPARERPNLRVMPDTVVKRVVLRRGRAQSVEVVAGSGTGFIDSGRLIVSAGAYNSPTLLLRSGIGPAHHLRSFDIPLAADRPGVGHKLR